jgi:cyclopropane-fatty-acyl-phospholipid synthase
MDAARLAETGLVPDFLVRLGIRARHRVLLRQLRRDSAEAEERAKRELTAEMARSPLALTPERANEQHYELPPEFFTTVLGERLKYSSALWPEGVETLEQAEEEMLALTVERAGIADGMQVLELGCGWGSLSLYMAGRFPDAEITAVTNSRDQKRFIDERASELGLTNLTIVNADMNDYDTGQRFDRAVSVEMFEHMRNWRELLRRIAGWLKPDGRLFAHFFSHERYAYPFVEEGPDDWMTRHFFSGGLMPSHDLAGYFDEHMEVEKVWRVNGLHYARTLRAWLDRTDERRGRVLEIFRETYGDQAKRWLQRWRMFFMACEEVFARGGGEQWAVTHLLMRPKARRR